jgi:protein-S-isoprenylcysteine O-methyltransferase Ste14
MWHKGMGTAVQLVAGTLLLFSGWGWGDIAVFFENSARIGLIALMVVGAGCAVKWRIEMQPVRKGLLPTGKQGWLLGVLLAFSILLMLFLPYADRRGVWIWHAVWPRYAGLSMCAVGGLVRLAALERLGPQFSAYVTLQPEHELVQEGIYGSIRHPLYLSLLLVPAGIAMVFASLLALPIFATSVIFVADRIRQEENLLGEVFGAKFREYQERTKMLVPGVW